MQPQGNNEWSGAVHAERAAIQCREYSPQPLPSICIDRDAHFKRWVRIRIFGKWGKKEQ